MASDGTDQKIILENVRHPKDAELEVLGDWMKNFYIWKGRRMGNLHQFQGYDFDKYIEISRETFWNNLGSPSEDLAKLGINTNIPYARKEILEFMGKLSQLNIKPRLKGSALSNFSLRMCNGVYSNWRTHSNQKVEKWWQLLYGKMNGTIINFIGYNDAKFTARYVREYDKSTKDYKIEEKEQYLWDDVVEELRPIEDIYVPLLEERDIQKQGKLIDRTQMPFKRFKSEFSMFDNAEYVYPGNKLSEDSLYFQLLASSGIMTTDRVEVLKCWDIYKDRYIILANGIWLNPMKGWKPAPNPFHHKMLPYTKTINSLPIDEKFFYGLSDTFSQKDTVKSANLMGTVMLEQAIRVVSRPYLTDDVESPEVLFGGNDIIQVGDKDAYRPIEVADLPSSAFNVKQGLENTITANIQGGVSTLPGGKQPRSAKEMMQLEQMKQQSMANAQLMYYDLLQQEIKLVVKTALQFYGDKQYQNEKENIVKSLIIPGSPMMNGGVGNLKIEFVKKNSGSLALFQKSIYESFQNQTPTEIIEAPVELIRNLDFEIEDIELVPERTTELEKATFVEQVMPNMQGFIQMGLVDPVKMFIQFCEKTDQHPNDYVYDKIMPQLFQQWSGQTTFDFKNFQFKGQGGQGQGQQTPGAQTGNILQSGRGMQNGPQGGAGNTAQPGGQKFGSQTAPALKSMMGA